MELIKVEYSCKSSQGIYANITYKNFWGKIKTKEAFLEVFWKDNGNHTFLYFPKWVNNGKNTPMYDAIGKEMIRQYELNLKFNIMIDKKWFEENMSFCSYDEYEKGKKRYVKACIKKQRQEDFEDFKSLPLLIKIFLLVVGCVLIGTIYLEIKNII